MFKRNIWAGIAETYQRIAMSWTVRGSNAGGGETFRTRPDRPRGPPSLLYSTPQVSIPGVKWTGRGVNHRSPTTAEVKERIELLLYTPSGPSWHVVGRTLLTPFTFTLDGIYLNHSGNGKVVSAIHKVMTEWRHSSIHS